MDVFPLFPLQTCLFPNIPLNLQLFEPRYLNMISTQLKAGAGFGIVSLWDGQEVGAEQEVFPVGMLVEIIDWRQQANGLLGITVIGETKLKVGRSWRQPDDLLMAEVELHAEPAPPPINELHHQGLVDLLQELKSHSEVSKMPLPEVRDTRDLSSQLAYLLPLTMAEKVAALSMNSACDRLTFLSKKINEMAKA